MKHPKMDRYLISHEDYELDYIAKKFNITRKMVREALEKTQSRSRRLVYAYIKGTFTLAQDTGSFDNITA